MNAVLYTTRLKSSYYSRHLTTPAEFVVLIGFPAAKCFSNLQILLSKHQRPIAHKSLPVLAVWNCVFHKTIISL
jgi:hypothetical protein